MRTTDETTFGWEDGEDFNPGGRALLKEIWVDGAGFDIQSMMIEAARMKDRLDRLHLLTRGDVEEWTRVFAGEGEVVLKLDTAVSEQRQLSTVYRQYLAEIHRRVGEMGGGDDEEDGLADLPGVPPDYG